VSSEGFSHAKKHLHEMHICTQCGYCRSVCPTFKEVLMEPEAARSRVILSWGLVQGEIEPDQSVIDALYHCTTCADCNRRCPSNVDVVSIMESVRQDLYEMDAIPENHRDMISSIEEYKNPARQSAEARLDFVPDDIPDRTGGGDVLLYFGCGMGYTDMKMLTSTINSLEKLEVDYTFLGKDESCCGFPELVMGKVHGMEERARQNLTALERLDPKPTKVVVTCAACYRAWAKYYKDMVGHDLEVFHIVQYYNELLRDGKLVFKKGLGKKIIYHDPCDIGRHMKIYDEPRNLLASIPDTELVEFEKNREEAACCGGGGGLKNVDYDLSITIAESRVRQAIDREAQVIVTACPTCKANLADAAHNIKKKDEIKVKVMDVVELVNKLI